MSGERHSDQHDTDQRLDSARRVHDAGAARPPADEDRPLEDDRASGARSFATRSAPADVT
jgi:hypothetical protein